MHFVSARTENRALGGTTSWTELVKCLIFDLRHMYTCNKFVKLQVSYKNAGMPWIARDVPNLLLSDSDDFLASFLCLTCDRNNSYSYNFDLPNWFIVNPCCNAFQTLPRCRIVTGLMSYARVIHDSHALHDLIAPTPRDF